MDIDPTADPTASTLGLHRIEDYEPLIGAEAVHRILAKADRLRGLRIAHVNSTFYGGGVAEILTPLTLLLNTMGIATGWRAIQGTPDFFACTKKIHNALQGARVELSDKDKAIYEQVVFENAMRLHLDEHDAVVVHDPQPLPLVQHLKLDGVPWIWQCHIDLSELNRATWDYLRQFVEQYAVSIFSLPDYAQQLNARQHFILPAINP